jgi:hypothetical protein
LQVPIFGCDLLVSPDILLAGITNAKGRAVHQVFVPPAVFGSFYAQAVLFDGGVPSGLCFSNGVSPVAN